MPLADRIRRLLGREPSRNNPTIAQAVPKELLAAARSVQSADGIAFTCNLCGTHNRVVPAAIDRETPSCSGCGSTVRFRSMIQLLLHALLRRDEVLSRIPASKTIRGIGISDAPSYALPLAEKFDYTNTFYHQEPRLDLTAVDDGRAGRYDFVICSDVLEHVEPPVSRAFSGARKLLKPGGVLIGSVPFSLEPATREHFPDLHEWSIDRGGDKPVLVNRTRGGEEQRFGDLVFHGGDGATLEMRLFSRAGLARELESAGFSRIAFADEPLPAFGIAWPAPFSIPFVAHA